MVHHDDSRLFQHQLQAHCMYECLSAEQMSKQTSVSWHFISKLHAGGVRLLATTATGYHVDMEEYGEHWNFFFTLAALALLSALTPRLSTHTSGIVGRCRQQPFPLPLLSLFEIRAIWQAPWSAPHKGNISKHAIVMPRESLSLPAAEG